MGYDDNAYEEFVGTNPYDADGNATDGLPPQRHGPAKYCVVCCGIILLLCALCVGSGYFWIASKLTWGNPTEVEQILSQEILEANPPEGYEGFAASKVEPRVAVLTPQGMQQNPGQLPKLMIVCFLLPPGTSPEEVMQQTGPLMQAFLGQQQPQPGAGDAIKLTIRGVEVEGTQLVGTNQQRQTVRQVSALIDRSPGSNQKVLLWFYGLDATFDEAAMKAFLKSIK